MQLALDQACMGVIRGGLVAIGRHNGQPKRWEAFLLRYRPVVAFAAIALTCTAPLAAAQPQAASKKVLS